MIQSFKRLVAFALASFAITSALAAEYKFILPNPPGSSSDIVARTVAEEYNRLTNNTLVLDYAPGGDHLVAVNRFKAQKELTVLLGSTTMHVFNHVTKTDLPYGDAEFTHAGWIGWTPHVWYVRSDSQYKTIEDVSSALKAGKVVNVAVDALSTQANALSVQRFATGGKNLTMIKYKGSPQSLADLLGGHVDIANSSISTVIVESFVAGKIRILGTTNTTPIQIDGNTIPAAAKQFSAEQFNGGFLISVNSEFANTPEGKKLRNDLLTAIRSNFVQEQLAKIQIQAAGLDGNETSRILKDYRKTVSVLVK